MQAKILCIERKRVGSPSFIPGLRKKGFLVEAVLTGEEATSRLEPMKPDLVIVNAASLRSNGSRICKSLRERSNGLPIVVILDSEQVMGAEDSVNVVLRLPFTPRKLINRIIPFIKGNPASMISAGPLQLDLERKTVKCRNQETRLTPRLTQLLIVLIQHQGEVIERDQLFSIVWKTSYTGDTRTLDVHISWLRQAIEEDPRNPLYLKTVRGIGYRLDI